MEVESLEAWRRAWTILLSVPLVFMFLFALLPFASADDMQRDYVKYVIQVERSTVIEGFVVDSNGEGIENASITGWAHSDYIQINVKTDENGYFRIVLSSGEDHEYFLNINENHSGYNGSHPYRGFNKRTVEDTIKSGEHHSLQIPLDYNPFDVELEETSGSLTRGWKPYSYSYVEENRDLTGYTYEQFAGYDASVPNYRTERYVTDYEPVYRTETYQERYVSHYEPVYRTESYIHHYATGVYYTTERVPHTGVYYTYEWRTRYYHGHVYRYQVRVPHYYTYYTYVSVPHYYQYPVYAYREVLDHYEPVYAYRTVTRQVLDHYDPVYAYRTVQDGYKTIRVPSYTTKWRITVEEWDWWGMVYNGTRTFMVYTEAEAAQYWVGKTYSWGWAGSGEVVLKETFYDLSNGQTVTSQPSAVWETRTSLTEPAKGDSIRNLRMNYETTTTLYSVTDYSVTEWGSRQTTVTATPKNGYTGDVRLAVEANSVQATLGSTRLSFSSSAWTTLTMRPNSSTSGSPHLVTIRAHDSNGRLVKTKVYNLNLSTSPKPLPSSSFESITDMTYESELESEWMLPSMLLSPNPLAFKIPTHVDQPNEIDLRIEVYGTIVNSSVPVKVSYISSTSSAWDFSQTGANDIGFTIKLSQTSFDITPPSYKIIKLRHNAINDDYFPISNKTINVVWKATWGKTEVRKILTVEVIGVGVKI